MGPACRLDIKCALCTSEFAEPCHAAGWIFPSILDALGFVLPWMNSSQHSYCPCNTGLCERRSASSGRHYPVPPPSDFCLQCPSGVFPLCLFPLGLFCPSPNFFFGHTLSTPSAPCPCTTVSFDETGRVAGGDRVRLGVDLPGHRSWSPEAARQAKALGLQLGIVAHPGQVAFGKSYTLSV